VQQSNLDFKGGFAGYFVRQVLFFGVILTHKLLHKPISLAYLSMYQSATIGAGTIVLYFFTRKYLSYRFNPNMVWIRRIFGYGGYIFGSGMVANISQNLDQLMTGKLIAPGYVGYYSVASRVNLLVDIPSFAAAEVLFPKASQAALEGNHRVKYLYEKMVAVLLAFTLPMAVVILIFPRFIMTFVAGQAYAASAPILQMYMVTGIFRPAQNQAANLLNSIGRPKLVFIANSLVLAGSLGINYFCLLRFGFYGAAIGTMTATLAGFVYWYFLMRRQIGLQLGDVFRHAVDAYRTVFSKGMGILRRKTPGESPS
jgi:O-antigen/teichoic acid export membrane protein